MYMKIVTSDELMMAIYDVLSFEPMNYDDLCNLFGHSYGLIVNRTNILMKRGLVKKFKTYNTMDYFYSNHLTNINEYREVIEGELKDIKNVNVLSNKYYIRNQLMLYLYEELKILDSMEYHSRIKYLKELSYLFRLDRYRKYYTTSHRDTSAILNGKLNNNISLNFSVLKGINLDNYICEHKVYHHTLQFNSDMFRKDLIKKLSTILSVDELSTIFSLPVLQIKNILVEKYHISPDISKDLLESRKKDDIVFNNNLIIKNRDSIYDSILESGGVTQDMLIAYYSHFYDYDYIMNVVDYLVMSGKLNKSIRGMDIVYFVGSYQPKAPLRNSYVESLIVR